MGKTTSRVRAIRSFFVRHNNIRIKVRVLPHILDVHKEFTGGKRVKNKDDLVAAFFQACVNPLAKYLGTIVLAGSDVLEEIVPHEVFHAVMYHFKTVVREDDEPAAYAIGILTSKILRQLKYIEYAK